MSQKDPIVEEVREARRAHSEEHGNDLHAICEDIRRKEAQFQDRIVRRPPKRIPQKSAS